MIQLRRPRKLTLMVALIITVVGVIDIIAGVLSPFNDLALKIATLFNSVIIGMFLALEGFAVLTLRIPPHPKELKEEQEEEFKKVVKEIEKELKKEWCLKGESSEE